MAVIRGRYISLSRSQLRRQGLEQQLEGLGVQEHYSWFPAHNGDAKAATARGLRAGEWGLWQSAEPIAGGVASPWINLRLAPHP